MSLLYGIDLDGVSFKFCQAFCKWLYHRTGVYCNANNLTDYYWYKCVPGLTEEVFWKEFHEFGRAAGYRNLDLIPETISSLRSLEAAGHKLVYITHRPIYSFFDTIEALKEHDFPQRESLVYVKDSKVEWVNELGVDVYIDDSPNVLPELCGKTKTKVYCRDYAYNRHLDLDFTRVSSWSEFLELEGVKVYV